MTPRIVTLAAMLLAACAGTDDTSKDGDTDETDTDLETDLPDTGTIDTDSLDMFDYEAAPVAVAFEPGTFQMGSPDDEVGHTLGERLHPVQLTYRFEVGTHEIMQGQYRAQVGRPAAYWAGCRRCPVESVTWHDAAFFANQLSEQEGVQRCYTCTGAVDTGDTGDTDVFRPDVACEIAVAPKQCSGYRLPTEAEWEYAARASGTIDAPTPTGGALTSAADLDVCQTPLMLDDLSDLGDQAWFCGNSDGTPGNTTRPSSSLDPNAAGLYDLLGNVWEWCHDGWVEELVDTDSPPVMVDPIGPAGEVDHRTVRGGGWNSTPRELRLGFRTLATPDNANDNLGFRVARTLTE